MKSRGDEAFEGGNYLDAIVFYDEALNLYGGEDSVDVRRILFKKGIALEKVYAWDLAARTFQGLIREDFPLSDFARYHLGESLLKLGDYKAASEHFQALLSDDSALSNRALLKLAEALEGMGDYEGALLRYWDAVRSPAVVRGSEISPLAWEGPPSRASGIIGVYFKIARLNSKLERWQEAYDALLEIVRQFPGDPIALSAADEISKVVGSGVPIERAGDEAWVFANLYYNRRERLGDALRILGEVIKSDPSPQAYFLRGKVYQRMGEYDRAIADYKHIIERYPDSGEKVVFSRWRIAGSYMGKREYEMGIEEYRGIYRDYPEDDLADDSIYVIALHYETAGDYDRALEEYNRLVDMYPRSEMVGRVFWRMCIIHLLRRDYGALVETCRRAMDSMPYDPDLTPQIYFWAARGYEKLGKPELSVPLYEAVIWRFPNSFYAWQAREAILKGKLLSPRKLRGLAGGLLSEGKYAEATRKLFVAHFLDGGGADLVQRAVSLWRDDAESRGERYPPALDLPWDTPSKVDFGPSYEKHRAKALELASLGFRDDAEIEMDFISSLLARESGAADFYNLASLGDTGGYRRAILSLSELSMLYHKNRIYLPAIDASTLILKLAADEGYLLPESFWRLLYPQNFLSIIEENSKKYKIDKYLLLALIHRESKFSLTIESRAGAVGLTQIMPATAEWIARKIGRDYRDDDLRNPFVNVEFGSWYLSYLMERYGGDIVYALSGYNAGPGNTDRWIKSRDWDDPLLFIEFIPFEETRIHVKKTLQNYYWYKRLYDRGDLSLGILE
ncbi:MAG: lytic transglycosylase domain-containing protein [bacterium]